MSTVIRAQLSKRNEYYIEKHRFYELKHYCLQYASWKRSLASISVYPAQEQNKFTSSNTASDPTLKLAESRIHFKDRIELLEKVAMEADPIIGPCVLRGVTTGLSYEALRMHMDIPCGKDMYYMIYRKFFWLLDKVRD
jgi:hypothetical protein